MQVKYTICSQARDCKSELIMCLKLMVIMVNVASVFQFVNPLSFASSLDGVCPLKYYWCCSLRADTNFSQF